MRNLLYLFLIPALHLAGVACPVRALEGPEPDPMRPAEASRSTGTGSALEYVHPIPLFLDARVMKKMSAPTGALVRLTPEAFDALVQAFETQEAQRSRERKAAKALQRQETPVVKKLEPAAEVLVPWVLDRVKIEGEIQESNGVVAHEIDLSVYGDQPRIIPIFFEQTAIASATLPLAEDRLLVRSQSDEQVPADQGAATVLYLTKGSGSRSLKIETLVPIQVDRSRRQAGLVIPPAIIQDVSLSVAGPASGVTVSGQAATRVEPGASGGKLVSLRTSRRGRLDVSWMRHGESEAPSEEESAESDAAHLASKAAIKPRIAATLKTLYGIGERGIKFNTQIELKNSRSQVSTITIALPLSVSVRSITGQDVQESRPSVENGRMVLTVRLRKPLKGSTSLELVGEMAIPSRKSTDTTTLELPIPEIVGSFRTQATAGVSTFATYQVRMNEGLSSGITSVRPAELPATLVQQSATPVLLGFRYSVAEKDLNSVRVSLDLQHFENIENVSTVINNLNAVSVLSPGSRRAQDKESRPYLQSVNRIVLQVTNARGRYLRLHLPKGAEVLASFVDLDPQPPALGAIDEGGQQEFLIALKRSEIYKGQMVPYPIEVAYRVDIDHELGRLSDLTVPLPRFNAPIVNSSWNVYFPDGYRPYDVLGTFKWSEKDRDLVLVQYGRDLLEGLLSWCFRLLSLAVIVLFFVSGYRMFRKVTRRESEADEAESRRFSGGFLVNCVILMSIFGVLSAIAVPNFKSARGRANIRACFANQKTIAGAIEMFNLDKNMNVGHIDASLLNKLVEEGYLQSVPSDPGQGASSSQNYRWVDDGNGIECSQHGSISNPKVSK